MKIIKYIILLISIIALSFQVYIDISPTLGLSLEGRVLIVLIEVLGFISVYWYSRNKVSIDIRKKYFKRLIWVLFFIYVFNLSYLLFLDNEMGREFHFIESIDSSIFFGMNLKPFRTIQLYINSYHHGYLPLSLIVINLLGNIVAFTPLGLFLPVLFKSQRRWLNYFITVSIIILAVELLQALTMSGSCDIDDYILNIIGSMFVYIIGSFFRKEKEL